MEAIRVQSLYKVKGVIRLGVLQIKSLSSALPGLQKHYDLELKMILKHWYEANITLLAN